MNRNQSPFVMKVMKVYHKSDIKKVGITAQIISGDKFTRLEGALFTCPETNTKWKVLGTTFIPSKALMKGILTLNLEMIGQGLDLEVGNELTLTSENQERSMSR
jgi:hypothetical protein